MNGKRHGHAFTFTMKAIRASLLATLKTIPHDYSTYYRFDHSTGTVIAAQNLRDGTQASIPLSPDTIRNMYHDLTAMEEER